MKIKFGAFVGALVLSTTFAMQAHAGPVDALAKALSAAKNGAERGYGWSEELEYAARTDANVQAYRAKFQGTAFDMLTLQKVLTDYSIPVATKVKPGSNKIDLTVAIRPSATEKGTAAVEVLVASGLDAGAKYNRDVMSAGLKSKLLTLGQGTSNPELKAKIAQYFEKNWGGDLIDLTDGSRAEGVQLMVSIDKLDDAGMRAFLGELEAFVRTSNVKLAE